MKILKSKSNFVYIVAIFVLFFSVAVIIAISNIDTSYSLTSNEQANNTESASATSNNEILDKTGFYYNKNLGDYTKRDYDKISLTAFRKPFSTKADQEIASATLYATAMGVYEAYINGDLVHICSTPDGPKDCVLQPGFTQTCFTKMVTKYDVKDFLISGDNVISAIVGPSWNCDEIANNGWIRDSINAKLIIKYTNGEEQIIGTDTTWHTNAIKDSASKVQFASIYQGEKYNANVDDAWMKSGYVEDSNWIESTHETDHNNILKDLQVIDWIGNQTIVRKDLQRNAKKVVVYQGATGGDDQKYGTINKISEYEGIPAGGLKLKKGQTALIDFAQNAAGWENFKVSGQKGSVLTIKHSEILNDNDGLKSRGNDGPEGSAMYINLRKALATTEYTLSGDASGESYHPSFTYYGFRYVELTCNEDITINNLHADTVTSIEKDRGDIHVDSSSNPQLAAKLNQFISNSRWSIYSNYLSIPTDCPQRSERKGWLADTLMTVNTGMFFTNAEGFLDKAYHDIIDARKDNYNEDPVKEEWSFPRFAPTTPHDYRDIARGIAGWADAGVLLPYFHYKMYGDVSIIKDNWDEIYNYVTKYLPTLDKEDHRGGKDTYAEWYPPNTDPVYQNTAIKNYVCCCYYLWDLKVLKELSNIAELSINQDCKNAINTQYDEIYYWYLEHYYNEDRTMIDMKFSDSEKEYNINNFQSVLAFALFLDLCPNSTAQENTKQMMKNALAAADGKINCGYTGASILLDALSHAGLYDEAYNLLLQQDYPSWLYMVNQGATTNWEMWDAYRSDIGFHSANDYSSFNHHSFSCAVSWMVNNMLGLNSDFENPAFKNIILKPHPSDVMNSVSGYYNISDYEKINISSNLNDENWDYTFDIPNVGLSRSAELTIPKLSFNKWEINGIDYKNAQELKDKYGVELVFEDNENLIFNIEQSGSFKLVSQYQITPPGPDPNPQPDPTSDDINSIYGWESSQTADYNYLLIAALAVLIISLQSFIYYSHKKD